jgi:hypothetical protein
VRQRCGAKVVCRYEQDDFTRRVGKLVVDYRLEGRSFEEIYWTLLRAGERNRKGKEWTPSTLRRMFAAEARLMQQEPGGGIITYVHPVDPREGSRRREHTPPAGHHLEGRSGD